MLLQVKISPTDNFVTRESIHIYSSGNDVLLSFELEISRWLTLPDANIFRGWAG